MCPASWQRDRDEQRLRREGIEQVGPIDAARESGHDVLLRIVRRSGRLDVRLGEVLGVALGDHGDADAAVERREKLRHGGAAGLAATADPLGIDLRAGQQVVDPADAVPRAEETEVRAEQDQTPSGVLVFGRSTAGNYRLAGPASRYSMRSPCPNGSYARTT